MAHRDLGNGEEATHMRTQRDGKENYEIEVLILSSLFG
jgi:hypothetical protein